MTSVSRNCSTQKVHFLVERRSADCLAYWKEICVTKSMGMSLMWWARMKIWLVILLLLWLYIEVTLFSDWPKANSELSKAAPVTPSSYRLCNNYVKDTRGHGESCHVWPRNSNYSRVMMSSSRALCQWRSKNISSSFASLTVQDIEK